MCSSDLVYEKGSEDFRKHIATSEVIGFSPEAVSQSADALLRFAATGLIGLLFTYDGVEQEGFVTPGWAFEINLDPKIEKFGKINFEDHLFQKTSTKAGEWARFLSAVFGAGRFLTIMDECLGDIAHTVDIPKDHLTELTIEAMNSAIEQQIHFYKFLLTSA